MSTKGSQQQSRNLQMTQSLTENPLAKQQQVKGLSPKLNNT